MSAVLSMLAVVVGVGVASADDSPPKRDESATNLAYMRLGAGNGIHTRQGIGGGPLLGAGYRAEVRDWGVDIGASLTIPSSERNVAFTNARFALQGMRFMTPRQVNSIYYGGGPAVGVGGGIGVDATGVIGYEFARDTPLRMFAQLDAVLPLRAYEPIDSASPDGYMAYFGMSFGVAYRANSRFL